LTAICGTTPSSTAVIVTKDEDFADMVAIGGDAPSVVWIRVGNTRRASLLAWFEPLIEQIVVMVEAGDRLIELR
jgi:predicted nuclease of predicted toxin-antitoxin system